MTLPVSPSPSMTFEHPGGSLSIVDPCYDTDTVQQDDVVVTVDLPAGTYPVQECAGGQVLLGRRTANPDIVGEFPVDSGQFLICSAGWHADYAEQGADADFDGGEGFDVTTGSTDADYSFWCHVTMSAAGHGLYRSPDRGSILAASTAYGDGVYPVRVFHDGGSIVGVEIDTENCFGIYADE